MWGALIGDIVGSRFEFNNYRGKDFELFAPMCCYTDDSVLTIAVAEVLMKYESISDEEQFKKDLVSAFHKYGMEYLSCGFGGRFFEWIIEKNTQPYNSFGNGSAMRVSAVAWYGNTLEEVERIARLTAEITHNDETCQKTIPVAMACFLEGDDFEDVLRNAISVGGDSDTLSAIACSVAEGFYGVNDWFKEKVRINLDKKLYAIAKDFDEKYISTKR